MEHNGSVDLWQGESVSESLKKFFGVVAMAALVAAGFFTTGNEESDFSRNRSFRSAPARALGEDRVIESKNLADDLVLAIQGWSGEEGSYSNNFDYGTVAASQFGSGFSHDWVVRLKDPLGAVAGLTLSADVKLVSGLASEEDTGLDYACSHWTPIPPPEGAWGGWSYAALKNCQLMDPANTGAAVALEAGGYRMRFFAVNAAGQVVQPYSEESIDAQATAMLNIKP